MNDSNKKHYRNCECFLLDARLSKMFFSSFIWQTDDVRPEYPRVHKFLNYWHDNIEAVIEEIEIY